MTERPRTVLVDMDGVMADFDSAAIAHIPEILRIRRSKFYVAEDYPESVRPSIEAVYNAPGFFENLQPMPGLLKGWRTLIDNGYDPRVASAPSRTNPTAIAGKIEWLNRIMVPEFGASVVERASFDRNKWNNSGVALLDDRLDVPRGPDGRDIADWEHILFGWAHLDTVPMATATFRLLSWNDTDSLLASLETIVGRGRT